MAWCATPPDRYRTGYLKLKSVLYDRTTGLPAFPVLFSELRTLLDSRREPGVLHLEIANLDTVARGVEVATPLKVRPSFKFVSCLSFWA